MNYIRIINWFWEEIPYIPGFKAAHVALFFAILDSINKNKWQETRIGYEYLVCKCKLAKRSYLESRQWLIENELIEMKAGKNAYQMASFSLGIAVHNCTTTDNSNNILPVHNCTTNGTHCNKYINNKHKHAAVATPFKLNKGHYKTIVDIFKNEHNWNDEKASLETGKFCNKYEGQLIGNLKILIKTWINNYREDVNKMPSIADEIRLARERENQQNGTYSGAKKMVL